MPTPRPSLPPDLPAVFSRGQLVALGASEGDLRGWVARGEVITLSRGVYTTKACWTAADRPQHEVSRVRHSLRALAVAAALGPDAVVRGRSAAAINKLPIASLFEGPVELGTHSSRRTRRNAALRSLDHERWTMLERDGVHVLAAADTVVDLAQQIPQSVIRRGRIRNGADLRLLDAVIAGDALLQRTARSALDLQEARARLMVDGPASWILDFLDGRRESPLESWSAVVFSEAGLPEPELQVEIDYHDKSGAHRRARVDFLWRTRRRLVVGEADGRLKYASGADLWAEKQREDALRAAGYDVVRWSWDDLVRDRHAVAGRIAGLLGLQAA